MLFDIVKIALQTLGLQSVFLQLPGLSNSNQLEWIEQKSDRILSKSTDSCSKCKNLLQFGHQIAKINRALIPPLLVRLCEKHNWKEDCEVYRDDTVSRGASGRHIANVLTLIDAQGVDGTNICWHFGNGACDFEMPSFNDELQKWWPSKPSNPPSNDMKSEGKTFNALHLSDFHIDLRYTVGSEADCDRYMCCVPESRNAKSREKVVEKAQKLGSYHCDTPQILLEKSLADVSSIAAEVPFEFGVFTGDMVSHDTDKFLSLSLTLQSEHECYFQMKKHLADLPIYPTFGNHDSYPYSQLAQNSSGFAGEFEWNAELSARMWKDYGWINEEQEEQARHTYGSYAVTTKHGLRVISLDSNFWYEENYYNYWNTSNPDPSGVFRWLVDELVAAENSGAKVWLVAHVPTGGDADAAPWGTEVLRQIIVRFSPHVIAASLFGHTHADQFGLYYDDTTSNTSHGPKSEKDALSVAWIGQSITPIDKYNPAWRYYTVDTKTFEIMDSRNYYSPLNDTYDVSEPSLQWKFLYSAREAYDPERLWPSDAPLNATFWHRTAQSFVHDSKQRQTFFDNFSRLSPFTRVCNSDECIQQMWCQMVGGTVADIKACLAEDAVKVSKQVPREGETLGTQ